MLLYPVYVSWVPFVCNMSVRLRICHPRVMSPVVGGFEGVCTWTGSHMLVTNLFTEEWLAELRNHLAIIQLAESPHVTRSSVFPPFSLGAPMFIIPTWQHLDLGESCSTVLMVWARPLDVLGISHQVLAGRGRSVLFQGPPSSGRTLLSVQAKPSAQVVERGSGSAPRGLLLTLRLPFILKVKLQFYKEK